LTELRFLTRWISEFRHLDGLIKLIKSLEKRGVMDFDSFLGLAEDIVNANDYIQIYNFKKLLRESYGESVYGGELPYPPVTPTPAPTSGGGSGGSGGSGGGSTATPAPTPTPTSTSIEEPTPSDVPAWAEEFIAKLAARNVVSGYPDGSVKPSLQDLNRLKMYH